MRVNPVGETEPSGQALSPTQGAEGVGYRRLVQGFGADVGSAAGGLANVTDSLANYMQQKQTEAQNFYAMQQLTKFQSDLSDQVTQRSRTFDPTGKSNFAQDVADLTTKQKQQFLESIPTQLQLEYSARADQVIAAVHQSAVKFQLDAADTYTRQGLTDAYTSAQQALDQDGSAANLDAQRTRLYAQIEASGLSTAEKQALTRKYNIGMESVSYKSEVRNGKVQLDALGVGSSAQAASLSLLSEFNPSADPATLKSSAAATEAEITKTVNPLVWAAQTDPVKASIIALAAHNNGQVPDSVKTALESGDANKLATAVEDAETDKGRGKIEASVIRGDTLLPPSRIDADPRYADIPYEDRLTIRRDAETEAAQDQTKAAAAAKAQHSAITNALFVSLSNGTAGQADIDSLKQAGVLDNIDDINKAQDTLKRYQGDTGLAAAGFSMLQKGIIFNPADDNHVKIENAMVKQTGGLDAIQNMDGKYAANTLVPMVRQMQDIPTDTVGLLTGMTRNADQRKALWAYDLLSQLQQASPNGYDARVPKDLAANVEFYRNAKDFYPPDQLIPMLRGGDTQEERVRNQSLREEAKGILRDSTKVQQVDSGVENSLTDLGWFHSATVPTGSGAINNFQSDYHDLFVDAYARYGDINLAKNAASELVKREWGVTSVGGEPTLMKWPPEKVGYNAMDGNYDWISKQVREDLKLPENEKFQLVSDDQTQKEFEAWQKGQGPAPSYEVIIKGQDGVLRSWVPDANDYNAPRRVYFDPAKEIAAQSLEWAKKAARSKIDEAQQVMQEAIQHHQETGHPIPPDVLDEQFSKLRVQTPENGGGGF